MEYFGNDAVGSGSSLSQRNIHSNMDTLLEQKTGYWRENRCIF